MTPQQEYERAEERFRRTWSDERGLVHFNHPDDLREDLARLYERDREMDPELRRLWLEVMGSKPK